MKRSSVLALGSASLALAVAPTSALAGQKVRVRIEGAPKTLQASRSVQTPGGFITRFGAPSGACSGSSAAGALNAATHGRWKATFSTTYSEYFINSILGETPRSRTGYWGIWVNNRYATTGACEIKLHAGAQILFAVDSVKRHEHPLGIIAPAKTTVGKVFKVKIVSYSDQGKATPAAGALLKGGGVSVTADKQGIVPVAEGKPGGFAFTASEKGYIRSAATTVKVIH